MSRYVLLEVADDSDWNVLLGSLAENPGAALLSPVCETPVHAEIVDIHPGQAGPILAAITWSAALARRRSREVAEQAAATAV